jgi:hypothetical protein
MCSPLLSQILLQVGQLSHFLLLLLLLLERLFWLLVLLLQQLMLLLQQLVLLLQLRKLLLQLLDGALCAQEACMPLKHICLHAVTAKRTLLLHVERLLALH